VNRGQVDRERDEVGSDEGQQGSQPIQDRSEVIADSSKDGVLAAPSAHRRSQVHLKQSVQPFLAHSLPTLWTSRNLHEIPAQKQESRFSDPCNLQLYPSQSRQNQQTETRPNPEESRKFNDFGILHG
jgi:hypothetical protein